MKIRINNDYQIRSYKFGWMIEKLHTIKDGKRKGEKEWREDSPAYPASLSAACESVMERILMNGPDTDLSGLQQALTKAVSDVRKAFELARKAA